jgi:ProP effector
MSNTLNQKRRRAERTRELVAVLTQRFPESFHAERSKVRPLAIGIQEHLREAISADPELENTPNWLIKQALARYTHAPAYLEAIIAGHNRINLDGSDAGPVSDEAREHARARREEQKKAAAERRRERQKQARRQQRNTTGEPSRRKLERLADKFKTER